MAFFFLHAYIQSNMIILQSHKQSFRTNLENNFNGSVVINSIVSALKGTFNQVILG